MYKFEVKNARVNLQNMIAIPTSHGDFQTNRANDVEAVWIQNIMNEMSCPNGVGACFSNYSRDLGAFQISVQQ